MLDAWLQLGPVVESVRVCRDPDSRLSLGFGYVNFYTSGDAERALDTMHLKPLQGRPCRLMWSWGRSDSLSPGSLDCLADRSLTSLSICCKIGKHDAASITHMNLSHLELPPSASEEWLWEFRRM